MENSTELAHGSIEELKLPGKYGFREVSSTGKFAYVDRKIMPWSEGTGPIKVPLVEVALMDGTRVLLGSHIGGHGLEDLASALSPEESERANKLFYTGVSRYIERPWKTNSIENPKSESRVYYVSDGHAARRVYFIDAGTDQKTGMPIILKAAVSRGKNDEVRVLSVLTREDKMTLRGKCHGKNIA